ncbi:hypothetical protein ScalyP_jg3493 [Parmales sp. scaly parma]|nr:hypothetical protein ScalyP_jg3493 [Parmales sp. scaly parma]
MLVHQLLLISTCSAFAFITYISPHLHKTRYSKEIIIHNLIHRHAHTNTFLRAKARYSKESIIHNHIHRHAHTNTFLRAKARYSKESIELDIPMTPQAFSTTTPIKKRKTKPLPRSAKRANIEKQRSSTNNVLSKSVSSLDRSKQDVIVSSVKRNSKTVTMVQGFRIPFKERDALLNTMKTKLGSGGTVDDSGVVELQGSFVTPMVEFLVEQGFVRAKGKGITLPKDTK